MGSFLYPQRFSCSSIYTNSWGNYCSFLYQQGRVSPPCEFNVSQIMQYAFLCLDSSTQYNILRFIHFVALLAVCIFLLFYSSLLCMCICVYGYAHVCVYVCILSRFSNVWLCDPTDCSLPGPSSAGVNSLPPVALAKPWENHHGKRIKAKYSITQIKVHWVDQLGLSCPAKLRKNIVWTLERWVSASSEHCLCTH